MNKWNKESDLDHKHYSYDVFLKSLFLPMVRRKDEDIVILSSYLREYKTLNHLLSINQTKESKVNIIKHLSTIFFGIEYIKHSFIKPFTENKYSILLLNGTITDLVIKYERLLLTYEGYIIHLMKLKLLNEEGLYEECISLNKQDLNDHIRLSKKKKNEYERKAIKEIQIYQKHIDDFDHKETFVDDYINITKIVKESILNNQDSKSMYILPYYHINNILTKESFIGNFCYGHQTTNSQHVYISTTNCHVGYIDLKNKYTRRFFQEIGDKITSSVLHNSYYLFQTIEEKTFLDRYSDQFSYIIVQKGEKIIVQDSYAHGIFLSNMGTYEVTTQRKFNDLEALINILKTSLEGYQEISRPLNNISEDKFKSFQGDQNASIIKDVQTIKLSQVSTKEIFGLNEFYDYKTHLYHFTVECTSDLGGLFYLPKEAFWTLFNKERTIMQYLATIIENKVVYYAETIKRYKDNINSSFIMSGFNKPKHNNLFSNFQAESKGFRKIIPGKAKGRTSTKAASLYVQTDNNIMKTPHNQRHSNRVLNSLYNQTEISEIPKEIHKTPGNKSIMLSPNIKKTIGGLQSNEISLNEENKPYKILSPIANKNKERNSSNLLSMKHSSKGLQLSLNRLPNISKTLIAKPSELSKGNHYSIVRSPNISSSKDLRFQSQMFN